MKINQAKRELEKCKMILQTRNLSPTQRNAIKQYQTSILDEFEDIGLPNELWSVLE